MEHTPNVNRCPATVETDSRTPVRSSMALRRSLSMNGHWSRSLSTAGASGSVHRRRRTVRGRVPPGLERRDAAFDHPVDALAPRKPPPYT